MNAKQAHSYIIMGGKKIVTFNVDSSEHISDEGAKRETDSSV